MTFTLFISTSIMKLFRTVINLGPFSQNSTSISLSLRLLPFITHEVRVVGTRWELWDRFI